MGFGDMKKGRVGSNEDLHEIDESSAGIVVTDDYTILPGERHPRIAAFVWGGKVKPSPTLPFGRWKGAA